MMVHRNAKARPTGSGRVGRSSLRSDCSQIVSKFEDQTSEVFETSEVFSLELVPLRTIAPLGLSLWFPRAGWRGDDAPQDQDTTQKFNSDL